MRSSRYRLPLTTGHYRRPEAGRGILTRGPVGGAGEGGVAARTRAKRIMNQYSANGSVLGETRVRQESLEDLLQRAGNPVPAPQFADRSLCLSRGSRRVYQLARRTTAWRETACFSTSPIIWSKWVEGRMRSRCSIWRSTALRNFRSTRPSSSFPAATTARDRRRIMFHLAETSCFVGRAPTATGFSSTPKPALTSPPGKTTARLRVRRRKPVCGTTIVFRFRARTQSN